MNNKYLLLRHGQALSNVKKILSSFPERFENHLTEKGKKQVKDIAKDIKGIDLIFASDLLRTKETAGIVSDKIGVKVVFDKRLREIGFGLFNGKTIAEFDKVFTKEESRLLKNKYLTETYGSVLKRTKSFLKEKEGRYKRKNILIVSHQFPLTIFEGVLKEYSLKDILKNMPEDKRITKAELRII